MFDILVLTIISLHNYIEGVVSENSIELNRPDLQALV